MSTQAPIRLGLTGHLRVIVGGVIMTSALDFILVALTRGFLGWKLTRTTAALFSAISILTSCFTVTRWGWGRPIHGMAIAVLFGYTSLLLHARSLLQAAIGGGPISVLILFLLSPLPVAILGLFGSLLGKKRATGPLIPTNSDVDMSSKTTGQ